MLAKFRLWEKDCSKIINHQQSHEDVSETYKDSIANSLLGWYRILIILFKPKIMKITLNALAFDIFDVTFYLYSFFILADKDILTNCVCARAFFWLYVWPIHGLQTAAFNSYGGKC